MKNNSNYYIIFLFKLPFLIVLKILIKILYIITITSLLVTIFIYLIVPIKHTIDVIYKLIFFINQFIEIFYKKKIYIISKINMNQIINNNVKENNINDKKNQYYIFTTIKSISDILKIIKITNLFPFVFYITHKNDLSFFMQKMISYFQGLQNQSIKNKSKISIKIIIQKNIPTSKELDKIKTLDKELFILEHRKNKFSLFY